MRDKAVERKISELQELIGLWSQFREMIIAVARGAGFTAEHDREFLGVKSDIARKFQSIADKFEKRTFPEEEVTDVLSQVVSLEQLKKMTNFTTDQFENTWHRAYIEFNKILGHLESERDTLARVNALGFGMGKLFKSKLFILLVAMGFMFGSIFLAYRFYIQKIQPMFEVSEEGEEGEEVEGQAEITKILENIKAFIAGLGGKVEEGKVEGEIDVGERNIFGVPVKVSWYLSIWNIIGAIFCGWLASSKGKSPVLWGALGFLCCPITFIVLLLKN